MFVTKYTLFDPVREVVVPAQQELAVVAHPDRNSVEERLVVAGDSDEHH